MKSQIRVAVVGVGNCAKSLVEGVALAAHHGHLAGIAFPSVRGYLPEHLRFVLGYDVDARKVGTPLHRAVGALPNCAAPLCDDGMTEVVAPGPVLRGPALDGVASHMLAADAEDRRRFLVHPADEPTEDEVAGRLRDAGVDVVLLYLPVGSRNATRFYVRACLAARVPFVNCIPEFVVSDPAWAGPIRDAGVPAVGDDMRSQVGASVLSQVLHETFLVRGAAVDFHCQTNMGGNTDFHNMLDRTRLASKKRSKEGVITSQGALRGVTAPADAVHAGPSDYVPYLGDTKVAHVRIEGRIFGGAPVTLDCRLEVQDSPNSAGVVVDAVRFAHVARRLGMTGPLEGVSAFAQKTPPRQMTLADAYAECRRLAEGPPV